MKSRSVYLAMGLLALALTGIRVKSEPTTTTGPDLDESKALLRSDETGRKAGIRRREREFKKALTGATLKGTWQMTGEEGLAGKAPLSEPRPEVYTIDKVSKASDDYWVITARIQYADKNVYIPVTVRVVWAEDVAMITLDEMALPGLGTYSARVMIHRGFYSGTWFGKNYGGVLSGQIVHNEAAKPDSATQPAQ
ncbi:MAG TPA: hypothetical protein VJZ71_04365 [Phycisphaerae bacterium]|nr:hypothetical protein [Phycisphaerae bacterium]